MILFIPNQIIAFRTYCSEGWNTEIMSSTRLGIGKEFVMRDIYLADEKEQYIFGYPLAMMVFYLMPCLI